MIRVRKLKEGRDAGLWVAYNAHNGTIVGHAHARWARAYQLAYRRAYGPQPGFNTP